MFSTITVDLVNGTKFHYLNGKSDIKGDFKKIKLKLYYSEYIKYVTCDAVLPINEFLSAVELTEQDFNLTYDQRYNFECEVNGISLALIKGRLNSITDTEIVLYFDEVLLKTSDGYKELGGDGCLNIYNRLTK